jgi:hypothetical protein
MAERPVDFGAEAGVGRTPYRVAVGRARAAIAEIETQFSSATLGSMR